MSKRNRTQVLAEPPVRRSKRDRKMQRPAYSRPAPQFMFVGKGGKVQTFDSPQDMRDWLQRKLAK